MIEPASTGVLGSLGINAWSFFAQLFNFSIVLIVMWKWVYTPLLKVMDRRAKEIADGLANAKAADLRLQDASAEKEKIIRTARADAHAMIEEVKSKAEAVRQDKLGQAKDEIEKLIAEAKDQIKTERDASAMALKREVASLVVLATEKIVDGIDEKSKRQLVEQASKDLENA